LDVVRARGIYEVGDSLRVNVTTDRDCHLKLINIGSSGTVTVLFPNRFQQETLIKANETVIIPAPDSDVRFEVRPPAGVEEIVAICRAHEDASFLEVAWDWAANAFQSYDGDRSKLQRDLVVVVDEEGKGDLAYAGTGYRIEE
jgi:hypothetical protein